MFIKYSVIIRSFAERHYLKNFNKKYSGAWAITWRAVCEELQRFDSLLETSIAEVIAKNNNIRIAKIEFRVAGTKESRKSSGNRCIVAVHQATNSVNVLFVYHKNDLGHGNETAQWKQIIKDNYPDYCSLL
jgi:hypothetical protein